MDELENAENRADRWPLPSVARLREQLLAREFRRVAELLEGHDPRSVYADLYEEEDLGRPFPEELE